MDGEKNYDKEMNFGTNTCTPTLSEYEWKKKWRKNLEPIQWTLYYIYMTTYYSDFHKECFSERKKKTLFAIVPAIIQ